MALTFDKIKDLIGINGTVGVDLLGSARVRDNLFVSGYLTVGGKKFTGLNINGVQAIDQDVKWKGETIEVEKGGTGVNADKTWKNDFVTWDQVSDNTSIKDIPADGATVGGDWESDIDNRPTALIDLAESGNVDVSGGTFTTSQAQKLAIVQGVGANTDIGAYNFRANTLTADGQTSGRVAIYSTDGLLSEDSDLTFSGATLTASNIAAFTLGGKLTAGSSEIEGSAFDIDGGDISAVTISGGLTWSAAQDLNNQNLTNVDIDSGAIDGTTIGSSSHTTIKGTTIDATTDFTIGTTVITDDSIVMEPSVSDRVTISAATNGVLNITTLDASGSAAANIVVTANGTMDLNSVALDIDASGAVTIDGTSTVAIAGASTSTYGDDVAVWSFNGSGAVSETGMTTFSLTPSSDVTILAGGDMFIDAQDITIGDNADVPIEIDATTLNIDATSWIRIDGAGLSLDSTAASNFTTSGGALTLTSAAAATWSTAAGALTINGAAGVNIQEAGGNVIVVDTSKGVDIDATDFDVASTGDIDLVSTNNAAGAITIHANGGTSETVLIRSDQGTSATEGAASVQLLSDVGGINVKSGLNAAGAIRITADGGTSETIILHADQGTGASSINLASDVGGITFEGGTDIAMVAKGEQITMADGSGVRYTFNTDSTPVLGITGNFILDGSGTIEIDAAGNVITLTSAKVHQQDPYSLGLTDGYMHRIDGIGQMMNMGDDDLIANYNVITHHDNITASCDTSFANVSGAGWTAP